MRDVVEQIGYKQRPIREECLIVVGGKLVKAGVHSHSAGDTTGGYEEASKFKRM